MADTSSKNDLAWQQFFDKHKIIDAISTNKYTILNSTDINEFRESRLMTKFDHKSQLPKLFSDNNLSILPISRGAYIVGSFDAFHNFEPDREIPVLNIDFPNFLESLDYNDITSESTAINCAFISKILHDFTGEDELSPTINGRMSSLSFSFSITAENGPFKIDVQNSQVEIDGGYEGIKSLSIIEAKNYISNDFLIRQLYYPYRLWTNKIKKVVRPIFLTYTNGIFHLREYLFEDRNHYNSLRLINQKKYIIKEGVINIEAIQKVLLGNITVQEPNDIPFPQADAFERVINLCELLKQKNSLTKEEITENYDFDKRQTNYYTDAGRYLGLIDKTMSGGLVIFSLTKKAEDLFKQSLIMRQIEFIKLILTHSSFKKTFELYLEKASPPTRDEIVEIMKNSRLQNVNKESTFQRRASTVLSWVNWIFNQIE